VRGVHAAARPQVLPPARVLFLQQGQEGALVLRAMPAARLRTLCPREPTPHLFLRERNMQDVYKSIGTGLIKWRWRRT